MRILLSIVTVCYNDLERLRKTYESIASQSSGCFEWIIKDGGSTDGTIEFLKEIDGRRGLTCLVGQDLGIYDAMNTAGLFAKGKYVLFLNAGDVLCNEDTVKNVVSLIENISSRLIFFSSINVDAGGSESKRLCKHPAKITYGMITQHQSVLFCTETFKENLYLTQYRLSADYELIGRILGKYPDDYLILNNMYISKYELGGINEKNRLKGLKEDYGIRLKTLKVSKASALALYLVHFLWFYYKKVKSFFRAGKVNYLGLDIENVDLTQATNQIVSMERGVVVTPNTDHLINLMLGRKDFYSAYLRASKRYADGWPLVLMSWLLPGGSLTSRVTGSDLIYSVSALCAEKRLSISLIGGGAGSADAAAMQLQSINSNLEVVLTECPPFGFEYDDIYCEALVRRIKDSKPRIIFLGVGSPKQELWADKYSDDIGDAVIVCCGAAFEFVSGHKKRAPIFFQKLYIEWLWRMLSEPRRLFFRYFRCGCLLPLLYFRELYARFSGGRFF